MPTNNVIPLPKPAMLFEVDGAIFTTAQMRAANIDEDLVDWLANAKVGDRFPSFTRCERIA